MQTLVFDAFSKKADFYQTNSIPSLMTLGFNLFMERGMIKESVNNAPAGGIVQCLDGNKSNMGFIATVNDRDHIRISCTNAGLDIEGAYKKCHESDLELQQYLQFAASTEYGYLTSNIKDSGTGLKLSAMVHLPSTAFLEQLPALDEALQKKNIELKYGFGPNSDSKSGFSAGTFFIASTTISSIGNEAEQRTLFAEAINFIIQTELENRRIIIENHMTRAKDIIFKCFASTKIGYLCTRGEALSMVAGLRWGLNLGLFNNLTYHQIMSIYYRVQDAKLKFILSNGKFSFPQDIANDRALQEQYMRMKLIRNTFEHIQVCE